MRHAAANTKGEEQMKKDVILHCKNGQKLEVSLARPFRSEENELKVIMAEAGAQIIFLFDELSGILFLNGTCPADVTLSDDNLEEVVTIDNTHYLVHAETAGKSSEGFYAIPAGEGISWSYAFFISNGIKMRSQKRQVGRILSDAGVVSETKHRRGAGYPAKTSQPEGRRDHRGNCQFESGKYRKYPAGQHYQR